MLEAKAIDRAAARLTRGRGALDLAIGELLLKLFETGGLRAFAFARQVDYARERLGLPGRTMFFLTRLARVLRDRPLLRRAVSGGLVSPRKAHMVAPVARGEDEATWTGAAMSLTEDRLVEAVRAAGREPGTMEFEVEVLRFAMTAPQQDRLDGAIALALEVLGADKPKWMCIEAICQEWLGEYGRFAPDLPDDEIPVIRTTVLADRVVAAVDAAAELVESALPDNPLVLDARIRELLWARQGADAAFGELAERISAFRVWRTLGYKNLASYCRERLGMGESTFRQRAWLERQMYRLPELKEALATGRVSYTKALLLAKDGKPENIEERITEATATTWQQLEQESTAEEDRQHRALGERRIWAPKEASETLALAIAAVQAVKPGLDAGEALAVMADYFISVWKEHLKHRRLPKKRRVVLARTNGLCARPGCSNAAEHLHHIVYQAQGGSDEVSNLIGLCGECHLRGVHEGRIIVRGEAGQLLTWEIATGEVWLTNGDDDVRSLPEAPPDLPMLPPG